MKLRECLYLLPGHGLDDFPRVLSSDEADALLAGWIALWHPNFINACRTTPRWQQAAYPPVELNDLLIVYPSVSEPLMRANFNDEVTQAGGMLRAARGPWQSFQDQLLSDLDLNTSKHH